MGLLPLAVLLLAAPLRAASLSEASEEAKAMAKLIKENPCYHNIELGVRSIAATFSPIARPSVEHKDPPPAAARLHHDRACKTAGSPAAPRAERIYFIPEGSTWGLRLITARGSDETAVQVVRDHGGGDWRLSAALGKFKTAELLARRVRAKAALTMRPGDSALGTAFELPYDVTLETIPFEHPD